MFSINAIAVTAEKMERAMADDIDRHWFQRYGSIAIASAMEGISQAAIINAQTGKVTQSGNGVWGTTVVERDPIDSTTEAKIAAGKVGAALGEELFSQSKFHFVLTLYAPCDCPSRSRAHHHPRKVRSPSS